MDKQRKNIFISHIHEDDHRLEPLKALLGKSGMEVRDGSINSDKPNDANNAEYIKYQILAPRIQWASVLVVLITPDTKCSDYVQWEIEYAASLGKRIVGIWDHGDAECEMPEALDRYADAVVGWQGDRITAAIEGTSNNIEHRDGSAAPPRETKRYSC
ncbi:TIR domain-containing protein [Ralstonia nicotianae]